jgi:hypothetical protein
MYETIPTIAIPTTSNAEPTIIATSFVLLERLFFSRWSERSKQSQVTLRITRLAHSQDGEMDAYEVDKVVDLNIPTF